MSLKGSKTTSDYIDFDRCVNTGLKLVRSGDNPLMGLYILISVNTGLRISDVLNLKWSDFDSDTLKLNEKKTKKYREIKINDTIRSILNKFDTNRDEFIFISQKGTVFSTQQINRLLKSIFSRENK